MGRLGNIRIPLQVDIGFGDPVVPAPIGLTYPVLRDQFEFDGDVLAKAIAATFRACNKTPTGTRRD
jgi:hypothetical protein